MKKIRFRAWRDLCYMFGVWIVMRYNKKGASELLIRWGKALENEPWD